MLLLEDDMHHGADSLRRNFCGAILKRMLFMPTYNFGLLLLCVSLTPTLSHQGREVFMSGREAQLIV